MIPRPARHVSTQMHPVAWRTVPCLALALCLAAPPPAAAGGGGALGGAAKEWTQLLNNAELGKIVGLESRILSKETKSLAAQLEQLATQIRSYEIMLRNIRSLPRQHLRKAMGSIMALRNIAARAGAIARSGSELDRFLRSDLITDPLFKRRGLDDAKASETYTEWNTRWHRSMATSLRGIGLTLDDTRTEAALIDRITTKFGTEAGQMQVLQGANQIAASMARQMNQLRSLTATQAETVNIAWGRRLHEMDRREAARRSHQRDVHETLERLQGTRGRSLNEIWGIEAR